MAVVLEARSRAGEILRRGGRLPRRLLGPAPRPATAPKRELEYRIPRLLCVQDSCSTRNMPVALHHRCSASWARVRVQAWGPSSPSAPSATPSRGRGLAMHTDIDVVREDLSAGYGLRFSAEFYGSKREKTVLHEFLQEACFIVTEISEKLRKPPGVYGRM